MLFVNFMTMVCLCIRNTIFCFSLLSLFLAGEVVFAASANTPLVVVSQVRMGDVVKQVSLTGSVASTQTASLSPQVSGRVDALHVEVGDRVQAGDLLLEIDSELEVLSLQATKAFSEEAKASLTDAQRRYENGRLLMEQKSISSNDLELLEAEVQIKKASLSRYIAEQRKQQVVVNHHQLKAPFSGVISERMTEVGEWIEPGNGIFTIVSVDELRAEFRVPQEYFMTLDKQSELTLLLDAMPNNEISGKIDAIVPVSDSSARTFLIHAMFDYQDLKVTPGMSVRGKFNLTTGKTGVVISRDALFRYPDGRVTVWTVPALGEEAEVHEQLVEIGHSFDGLVSIKKGLQAGAYVVVRGNESLQQGQTVRIQQQP